MMNRFYLAVATGLAVAVAACTSPAHPLAESSNRGAGGNGQLDLKLVSGRYHCELGIEVGIERDARNPSLLQIDWKGRRFAMDRNASYSGLPRYEHRASGLVWIDLPWKGILLDSRTGRPLASECTVS